ncbi:MAG: hypothetical protein HYV63_06590 [Candidatus Schekmanbacteria bacterium]|nr:hypothetical protein [Candidatus Schekmanbacteria bacterium]
MAKKLLGVVILVGVIAAVIVLQVREKSAVTSSGTGGSPAAAETVRAYVGGEKSGFLDDPAVKQLLAAKYGLSIDGSKAGSIEMVTSLSLDGKDCVWPSSQTAAEIFRARGAHIEGEETIFNSPIVLYAWAPVADALTKAGFVSDEGTAHYVTDFSGLIAAITEEKKWSDIGVAELFGKISIFTTDPSRSSSGAVFAGLVANMLNGGNVATEQDLPALLPRLKSYYARLGHLESSSGDLFQSFLKTGIGARPIIAGYESQLVEFFIDHQEFRQTLREKIRILYPKPTVWSEHPLIAMTGRGKKLIEALKDPEIQRLAWEKHGFRSGLLGVQNDPRVLELAGIPESITAVLPLPAGATMNELIRGVQ